MKYHLIHTTKTGGTALLDFLLKNYPKYFKYGINDSYLKPLHSFSCGDSKRPIIIFRNPIDRFNSMFGYWKNGSSKWPRSHAFLKKYQELTMNEYASLIRNNRTDILNQGHTWDVHYAPQSRWFTGNYENIIVIQYQKNLENSAFQLLEFLDISNKGITLKRVNSTKKNKNYFEDLNQESLDWFYEYFKEDFEIQQKILSTPEIFKKVI